MSIVKCLPEANTAGDAIAAAVAICPCIYYLACYETIARALVSFAIFLGMILNNLIDSIETIRS